MWRLVELGKLKNFNDLIETQTFDLPACSIVSDPAILCVRQRLLLFSGRDPDTDAAHIRKDCTCWSMAAIIKYIVSLQSLYLLAAIPPFSSQCLHIVCSLYRFM
jgi:hypothetical protein